MSRKLHVKKPGTVQKVIQSPYTKDPEKAEIRVEGADELYREIRIENTVQGENGEKAKLKPGAHVEVVVEADAKDTIPQATSTPDGHSRKHHSRDSA
jgi:hypothetical protein